MNEDPLFFDLLLLLVFLVLLFEIDFEFFLFVFFVGSCDISTTTFSPFHLAFDKPFNISDSKSIGTSKKENLLIISILPIGIFLFFVYSLIKPIKLNGKNYLKNFQKKKRINDTLTFKYNSFLELESKKADYQIESANRQTRAIWCVCIL